MFRFDAEAGNVSVELHECECVNLIMHEKVSIKPKQNSSYYTSQFNSPKF